MLSSWNKDIIIIIIIIIQSNGKTTPKTSIDGIKYKTTQAESQRPAETKT